MRTYDHVFYERVHMIIYFTINPDLIRKILVCTKYERYSYKLLMELENKSMSTINKHYINKMTGDILALTEYPAALSSGTSIV